MEEEKFDFEAFARKAAEDLKAGKPLVGKDGVFTPLLKQIIEGSLEGELDNHLSETRASQGNSVLSSPVNGACTCPFTNK